MPKSCSAYNCTNRYRKSSGISFHRFPHDIPELAMRWKLAIRRRNWTPSNFTLICSEHFKEDDYNRKSEVVGKRYLKPDAVPSIFNFSKRPKQALGKTKHEKYSETPISPSKNNKINTFQADTPTFNISKQTKSKRKCEEYSEIPGSCSEHSKINGLQANHPSGFDSSIQPKQAKSERKCEEDSETSATPSEHNKINGLQVNHPSVFNSPKQAKSIYAKRKCEKYSKTPMSPSKINKINTFQADTSTFNISKQIKSKRKCEEYFEIHGSCSEHSKINGFQANHPSVFNSSIQPKQAKSERKYEEDSETPTTPSEHNKINGLQVNHPSVFNSPIQPKQAKSVKRMREKYSKTPGSHYEQAKINTLQAELFKLKLKYRIVVNESYRRQKLIRHLNSLVYRLTEDMH